MIIIKFTHVNGTGEDHTFSQYSEAISECRHIVLSGFINGFNWLVSLKDTIYAASTYLERHCWVELSNGVSCGVFVDNVEHLGEEAWV